MLHHHTTDDHQRTSSGKGGDGLEDISKEQPREHQHTNGDGRQSGLAAFFHTCSGFDVGGGRAGTADGTGDGGSSVGHEGFFRVLKLVVLVDVAGLATHGVQGSCGVKDVNEEEGDHNQHEVGEVVTNITKRPKGSTK